MEIYKRFLEINDEINKLKEEKLQVEYAIYEANQAKYEAKEEGCTSVKQDGFKVSVTKGYKVDVDQKKAGLFPDGFKLNFSFDKKLYKSMSPDEQIEIDECLTMTPRKPSFKVEVLDDDQD